MLWIWFVPLRPKSRLGVYLSWYACVSVTSWKCLFDTYSRAIVPSPPFRWCGNIFQSCLIGCRLWGRKFWTLSSCSHLFWIPNVANGVMRISTTLIATWYQWEGPADGILKPRWNAGVFLFGFLRLKYSSIHFVLIWEEDGRRVWGNLLWGLLRTHLVY